MSLFDLIPDAVWQFLSNLFKPILGPLTGVISIFTAFRENTVGIFEAGGKLVSDVLKEYQAMKEFKIKPNWKSRVISVPDAVENIQKLVAVPNDVLKAFQDLIRQLREKLDPARFDVEELEGVDDLEGLLKRFGGKVAKGAEKLVGALQLIADALTTIRSTIADLQSIVDAVKEVRKDLDHLDGLFLPQNNGRAKWKLAEGQPQKTITIRTGERHKG